MVKKRKVKKKAVAGKNLTKQELTALRKSLLREKMNIIEELIKLKGEGNKSFKDASGDLSGYSFHMADMGTDLYDREFALELAEGERERLFALNDAIKRIDEGKYGICDRCEESIPKQRLKVMPQARLCIKCQKKEESTSR